MSRYPCVPISFYTNRVREDAMFQLAACVLGVVAFLYAIGCTPPPPSDPNSGKPTTAPFVSNFSINNDANETTSRTVTLNNNCTGNPTQYVASESSDFSGASWQAYASAPSFTLSTGNGTKTVYFKVKNTDGESASSSDTISLNEPAAPSPPIVSSFAINNGAGETTSRTVTLNNSCTANPTQYVASESSDFSGASWQAYAAAPSFTLSSGNGAKTVYFKVKNASQESDPVSDEILLSTFSYADLLTLDLGSSVTMVLIKIPAGSFQMGTASTDHDWLSRSRPVHAVTFVQPFYMGKYEVTQAQWKAVMGTDNTPSHFSGDNRPVEKVSWNDALAFCQALSTKVGFTIRLSSEAEWEYACKAGSGDAKFYFGNDDAQLGNYAWYDQNSSIGETGQTHDVGGKMPNPWGLYDMHGNVWEWCQDVWHTDYTGSDRPDDGGAWTTGGDSTHHALRGGSYRNAALYCRSAYRGTGEATGRPDNVGFRVAADATNEQVSAKIGPAGGQLTHFSGASISVPAGALAQETEITLNVTESPTPPAGFESIGTLECGPDGLTFNEPISVRVPLPKDLPPGTLLSVQSLSGSATQYEPASLQSGEGSLAIVGGGAAEFLTNHFTRFTMISRTEPILIDYEEPARTLRVHVKREPTEGLGVAGPFESGDVTFYIPYLWRRLIPTDETLGFSYYNARRGQYKEIFKELLLQTRATNPYYDRAVIRVNQTVEDIANAEVAVTLSEIANEYLQLVPATSSYFDAVNAALKGIKTGAQLGEGFRKGKLAMALYCALYDGLLDERISAMTQLLGDNKDSIGDGAIKDGWLDAVSEVQNLRDSQWSRVKDAVGKNFGELMVETALSGLGEGLLPKVLAEAAWGTTVSTATVSGLGFAVGIVIDAALTYQQDRTVETRMIMASTLDNTLFKGICTDENCITSAIMGQTAPKVFHLQAMRLYLARYYYKTERDYLAHANAGQFSKTIEWLVKQMPVIGGPTFRDIRQVYCEDKVATIQLALQCLYDKTQCSLRQDWKRPEVVVTASPTATIIGTPVRLSSVVSGGIAPYTCSWSCSPTPAGFKDAAKGGGEITLDTTNMTIPGATPFTITCTITDSSDLTATGTATVTFSPYTLNSPPTITNPSVTGTLTQSQAGKVTASCMATDTDGTVQSVKVDLSAIGGSSTQALTKGTGNQWSWSGSVTPPTSGSKTVTFTAIDDKAATGTVQLTLSVRAMAQVAKPTLTPQGGATFVGSTDVTISCTDVSVEIRYTTDGTVPSSTHGNLYDRSIGLHLTDTTTLKAMAYKTGMSDSDVSVGTYTAVGTEYFRAVGYLPTNRRGSVVTAVSADGTVVVGYCWWADSSSTVNKEESFRWCNGVISGLGFIGGESVEYNCPWGVSADGLVVVGEHKRGTGGSPCAFRWSASSGMTVLPDLTSPGWSRAMAASSDGSVIFGGSYLPSTQGGDAVRWSNGTVTDLGAIVLNPYELPGSRALAASADGSVVVGYYMYARNEDYGWRPCKWVNGTIGKLGLESGDGRATAISPDGSIIVGYYKDHMAFRIKNGVVKDLGDIPGSVYYTEYSQAYGVSADGGVVVGMSESSRGYEASRWDEVHGMESIKDILINRCGVDVSGWSFGKACGVSADGVTIVGQGANPSGRAEGWIARIPK